MKNCWYSEERLKCRLQINIPLIEKFVDNEGQKESKQLLEKIGIKRFDLFSYKTDIV